MVSDIGRVRGIWIITGIDSAITGHRGVSVRRNDTARAPATMVPTGVAPSTVTRRMVAPVAIAPTVMVPLVVSPTPKRVGYGGSNECCGSKCGCNSWNKESHGLHLGLLQKDDPTLRTTLCLSASGSRKTALLGKRLLTSDSECLIARAVLQRGIRRTTYSPLMPSVLTRSGHSANCCSSMAAKASWSSAP